jgi:threonine aldolase
LADTLRDCFTECGYPFFIENTTNQLFPILPGAVRAELAKKYTFIEMDQVDEDRRACRFCTSWATKAENVEALCRDLREISK